MRRTSLGDTPDEGVSHDPAIPKRVLIRAGTIPHVTQLATSRIPPGASITPHRHADMFEVFEVVAGTGCMRVDEAVFPIGPGDCIVVEPGEEHTLTANADTQLVVTVLGVTVA